MTALEKHLFLVQQKLEHLNSEVATLIALTSSNQSHVDGTIVANSTKPSTEFKSTSNTKSNVGINRYRQLANEHSDHAGRGLSGVR